MQKLGFGLMRLPMAGEEINLDAVKEMVDRFLERGFTYFDTAYVYANGQSEVVAGKALVKRHPRDSFQLATKMPVWMVKKPEDLRTLFQTQLQRTGAGYYDYYLLHSLGKESYARTGDLGAWEFVRELKEQGLIRNLGFRSTTTRNASIRF